jgi:hypothetical protein
MLYVVESHAVLDGHVRLLVSLLIEIKFESNQIKISAGIKKSKILINLTQI